MPGETAPDDMAFRDIVAEAIDDLPEEWARRMDAANIVVTVEDEPQSYLRDAIPGEGEPLACCIKDGYMPTKIVIFRELIWRVTRGNLDDLRFLVRCLIEHELGHAFGLTEAEIAAAHRRIR